MLRLLFWLLPRILLLWLLYLLIKRLWLSLSGSVQEEGGLPPRKEVPMQPMVRDPQCGIHLPQGDALTLQSEKGLLYFCSRECRDAYLQKKE